MTTTYTADLKAAALETANYLASARDAFNLRGEALTVLASLRAALRGPDEPRTYTKAAMLIETMPAATLDVQNEARALAVTSLRNLASQRTAQEQLRIAESLVRDDVQANVGNAVEKAMELFGEPGQVFDEDEHRALCYRQPDTDDFREALPAGLYVVEEGTDPADGATAWRWYYKHDDAPEPEDSDWFETEAEALADLYDMERLDRPDGAEVQEYWLVTNYLAHHLEGYGESVVDSELFHSKIWGRCSTGQAIKMDWIIERIALDILNAGEQDLSEDAAKRGREALVLLSEIVASPKTGESQFQAEAARLLADVGYSTQAPYALAVHALWGFDPRDLV